MYALMQAKNLHGVRLLGTDGEAYNDWVLSPFIKNKLVAGGITVGDSQSPDDNPHLVVDTRRLVVDHAPIITVQVRFYNDIIVGFIGDKQEPLMINASSWGTNIGLMYLGNTGLVRGLEQLFGGRLDHFISEVKRATGRLG